MAYPDLTDQLTRLRMALDEPTARMWSDAELTTIINDAERNIAVNAGCIVHLDYLTLTANTRAVAFSGYGVKYVAYMSTDGYHSSLRRITVNHFGRVKCNGIYPQYYAVWDGNLLIEPIPTKAYTLSCYVIDFPASFMSAGTDKPEIPKAFHEDILYYSAYLALIKRGEFKKAGEYYEKYVGSINRKMALDMPPEYVAGKNDSLLPDAILRQQPQQGGR